MRKWLVAALQRALLRPLQIGRLSPDSMNGEPDCSLSRDAALVKVGFMPLNGQGRREAKTHAWLLWAYCRLVDLMDERLRVERWTRARLSRHLKTAEAESWAGS